MIKILILGGGFGGVRTALDLEKRLKNSDAEIILVDKNPYHFFAPNLYEVASAYAITKDNYSIKLKKTVCIPFADIFAEKKINFIQAEINSVDLENKKVMTSGGGVIKYDYLVLALGGQAADFGIPGVKDYAYQFKSVEDGLMIHNKLDFLFKNINDGNKSIIKILICGGGFTGVELSAEISVYLNMLARKCKINHKCHAMNLFEAGLKIMPSISDKDRDAVVRRLTNLGIAVMTNSQISEVGPDFIRLKSGEKFQGDMIVWTTGIKANSLLESISDLALSKSGKITVDLSLRVKESDNIYAIGDNIEFVDHKTQKPIPGLGYLAIAQGKIAAQNIVRSIYNKNKIEYRPVYIYWITPIGGKNALARVINLSIGGLAGWLIRELIDLKYLISILSFRKALKLFSGEVIIFTRND